MPQMSFLPDEVSYSAAISACEKGAQWQMALHVFSAMQGSKAGFDIDISNIIIITIMTMT